MSSACAASAHHDSRPEATLIENVTSMVVYDTRFTRVGTTRWSRQRLIPGPKRGCSTSQRSNRAELLLKAQAARSMNGVVGSTGKTAPSTPRPKKSQPSAK